MRKSILYPAMLTVMLLETSVSAISISGTVTDNLESPVADVKVVSANESDATQSHEAFTGSSGKYSIELPGETVPVGHDEPVPFSLGQNFPNPFNPTTTIPFSVSEAGYINLSIYNALGQKIRILVDSYTVTLPDSNIETSQITGLNPEDKGIYDFVVKTLGNNMTENILCLTIGDTGGQLLCRSPQRAPCRWPFYHRYE